MRPKEGDMISLCRDDVRRLRVLGLALVIHWDSLPRRLKDELWLEAASLESCQWAELDSGPPAEITGASDRKNGDRSWRGSLN